MSELFWSKGDHNTCAFARAVHSMPEVLPRESRFCSHEDLRHVLGNCVSAKSSLFLSDIYLFICHSCLELNYYTVAKREFHRILCCWFLYRLQDSRK